MAEVRHTLAARHGAVRPFAGLLESLIIAGIEAAYQLAVKRK